MRCARSSCQNASTSCPMACKARLVATTVPAAPESGLGAASAPINIFISSQMVAFLNHGKQMPSNNTTKNIAVNLPPTIEFHQGLVIICKKPPQIPQPQKRQTAIGRRFSIQVHIEAILVSKNLADIRIQRFLHQDGNHLLRLAFLQQIMQVECDVLTDMVDALHGRLRLGDRQACFSVQLLRQPIEVRIA